MHYATRFLCRPIKSSRQVLVLLLFSLLLFVLFFLLQLHSRTWKERQKRFVAARRAFCNYNAHVSAWCACAHVCLSSTSELFRVAPSFDFADVRASASGVSCVLRQRNAPKEVHYLERICTAGVSCRCCMCWQLQVHTRTVLLAHSVFSSARGGSFELGISSALLGGRWNFTRCCRERRARGSMKFRAREIGCCCVENDERIIYSFGGEKLKNRSLDNFLNTWFIWMDDGFVMYLESDGFDFEWALSVTQL